MTAPLASLEGLLERVAQLLEQDVLPHVAGRPFTAALDAAERLRAIAATLAADEVPDYCAEAECQNITAGPADLCLSHLIEFAVGRRLGTPA